MKRKGDKKKLISFHSRKYCQCAVMEGKGERKKANKKNKSFSLLFPFIRTNNEIACNKFQPPYIDICM